MVFVSWLMACIYSPFVIFRKFFAWWCIYYTMKCYKHGVKFYNVIFSTMFVSPVNCMEWLCSSRGDQFFSSSEYTRIIRYFSVAQMFVPSFTRVLGCCQIHVVLYRMLQHIYLYIEVYMIIRIMYGQVGP